MVGFHVWSSFIDPETTDPLWKKIWNRVEIVSELNPNNDLGAELATGSLACGREKSGSQSFHVLTLERYNFGSRSFSLVRQRGFCPIGTRS